MGDFGVRRREVLKAAGGAVVASALPGAVDDAFAANRSARIRLKRGCVFTSDPKLGDFDEADVLVEGKKIIVVGPNLSAAGASIIDASGTIVLPGFVDSHHHLYQAFLRNIQGTGLLARSTTPTAPSSPAWI